MSASRSQPGLRRLFLTRRWPDAVEAELQKRYRVTLNLEDRPLETAELQAAMLGHDVLCPTVSDRIGAEILSAEDRVGLVANYGAGLDHIDLKAASAAGLAVTNTPDVLTEAPPKRHAPQCACGSFTTLTISLLDAGRQTLLADLLARLRDRPMKPPPASEALETARHCIHP